jgi:hypothetical protein
VIHLGAARTPAIRGLRQELWFLFEAMEKPRAVRPVEYCKRWASHTTRVQRSNQKRVNNSIANFAAAAVDLAEAARVHGLDLPDDCIVSRQLRCPWCDVNLYTESSMMFHIEKNHDGEALGEKAVQFFRGLDRGICNCGKLRGRTIKRCNACNTRTAARSVAEGDVVSRKHSYASGAHSVYIYIYR